MTYKEALLNCTGFIDRNEFSYNQLIVDNQLPLQQGQNVEIEFISNELFNNTTAVNYVLQGLNLGREVKAGGN